METTTTTLEQIEWNVYRRYNEFASFHSDLQKVISNQTRNRLKLTKLFPGKFLVGNMRSDKIDKRRHQLQLWLDVIITHPETSKTKLLDDFLQVAKHISTHQNNLAKARSLSISIQPTMSQTLPPPIVHNASSGTDITSSIIE